jgi:hypothetical protein
MWFLFTAVGVVFIFIEHSGRLEASKIHKVGLGVFVSFLIFRITQNTLQKII